MGSVTERRRYIVTVPVIGWAPTQNDLCLYWVTIDLDRDSVPNVLTSGT